MQMGINLECVITLAELVASLPAHPSVMEFGAQDISADATLVTKALNDRGYTGTAPVSTAPELYRRLGFQGYTAIDFIDDRDDVRMFDLNQDIDRAYGFTETFDLVTNLGTLEHCFDQAAGFRNMHRMTKPGGYMLQCLPVAGHVNHGFFNYHPRLMAEIAIANDYELSITFITADFTATRIPYSIEAFQAHDHRELLMYAVLKRVNDKVFINPVDRMFTDQAAVMASEFRPYVKAPWSNTVTGSNSSEKRTVGGFRSMFASLRGSRG
jgi:SAM-dependent methyltransferase